MTVINFGKYKGFHISKVPDNYVRWASENISDGNRRLIFTKELENRKFKKKYTIVLSRKQREDAIAHVMEHEILSFDTETTGLNTRKDKVIGISFSGEEGVGFYVPIYAWDKESKTLVFNEENNKIVISLLELMSMCKLMMWNGSFDIRIIKSNFDIDLTGSLYIEGMLLKHTLNEEGPFGLKKVGIELRSEIGLNVEEAANKEQIELKENVKANGGSTTKNNFEMYKADLDVMGKYAAADADLTIRICNYYLKKLKEEGLEKFFFEDEVMPLYKTVTIPMEDRGVKIDMDLLLSSKAEIIKDIKELEKKVINGIFSNEDAYRWYNEKVETFTDEVPRGKYAQGVAQYFSLNLPKTKAGKYSISRGNVEKLPPSKGRDFLLGDINTLDLEVQFAIKEKIYLESNDNKKVNISSKKQLGEIVFDYMNVKPLSKTDKGAPQFNDQMVEYLIEEGHEWAKDLHNYNKLSKIKSSYIDRFLDNSEEGKYYFSYKQHGTISGRYGSDAQQLPRPMEDGQESEVVIKYNNRIRKLFIAGKGRKFIDCDYESLEPHTFAHISGDEGLRDIFRNGHDFYSTIAIATENLEGFSADKKADNYLGKLDKVKRQVAKAYALGIPYGMSAYALGKSLDMTTEEAQELVDGYLDAYPDLKKWMSRSKTTAQTKGLIISEAGRVRHLSRVKELYSVFGDNLMDFKFRKKLEKSHGKEYVLNLYRDYKNGVNNSRNFQIQSMAASIVNRAAIAVNREFKSRGIDGWCCAQIHDQLIFNVPEEKAEECRDIVQELMENTTKLSLKLKAPAEIGDNWYEAH